MTTTSSFCFWSLNWISNSLCVNVDFGGFAGRVLHDQEHFGDELNDVASLDNQVTFPLVSKGRREGRWFSWLLEMQAARLKIGYARRGAIKLDGREKQKSGPKKQKRLDWVNEPFYWYTA